MRKTNLMIGRKDSKIVREKLKEEITHSMLQEENIVIFSNEENYYHIYKKELEEKGYKTLIFNLKESKYSHTFNPLHLPYYYYKQNEIDKAIDLLNALALEIFKTENRNVDPFWENSAANYFMALALILFKEGKEEEINLGSIQAMKTQGEEAIDGTSVIRKYFDSISILDSIYVAGSQVIYAPSDTRGSIISVVGEKLNFYCIRPALLNNLCGNDIDLTHISNKTAIFIIGEDDYNCLGNVLLDQIYETKIPFTCYIDNLDNTSKILKLKKYIENHHKLYMVTHSQQSFLSKYDIFLMEQIENIVECTYEEEEFIYERIDFPISKKKEHQYFNLKNFMAKGKKEEF